MLPKPQLKEVLADTEEPSFPPDSDPELASQGLLLFIIVVKQWH